VLKKRSTGPTIGKPSDLSLQLFFMASYDMDRFRRFATSASFKKTYHRSDEFYAAVEEDDVALMQFGFKLLCQVLYGEIEIPEVEGAWQRRLEDRQKILNMRREIEKQEHWKKREEKIKAAVSGDVNVKD
jgi:hypothetical protein